MTPTIPEDSGLWNVKYFQEYLDVIERRHLPRESCCLCGSVALAVLGLRENHDIDFICSLDVARAEGFKGDHTYFLGDNKRVALIPTSPPHFPQAFHGMTFLSGHSTMVDGFRVATIEDSYLFKCAWLFHCMENDDSKVKDAEDVKLMNEHFQRCGFDDTVLPEDIWDGGEIWKVGSVAVKLPSPYRLKAYNPMEILTDDRSRQ